MDSSFAERENGSFKAQAGCTTRQAGTAPLKADATPLTAVYP
jgi:hypothetical protein